MSFKLALIHLEGVAKAAHEAKLATIKSEEAYDMARRLVEIHKINGEAEPLATRRLHLPYSKEPFLAPLLPTPTASPRNWLPPAPKPIH